ncbi:MAG: metallophosphoesterase family protein [Firmicutes bacterium]|nr:metallophosphoesterase family protein [Bacillota bacterium]
MNILVLSDTHGNISKALELVERVETFADIDMIIHCGDFVSDAFDIEAETGIPVTSVPGNCDGCRERFFRKVPTPAGDVLVIHGHTEDVKFGLMRLLYLAEAEECKIVCFGHTHVALNEIHEGIRLINPGSASRPRDGSKGSCALLVCEADKVASSIIRY